VAPEEAGHSQMMDVIMYRMEVEHTLLEDITQIIEEGIMAAEEGEEEREEEDTDLKTEIPLRHMHPKAPL
jgi:hemerythrin-like domain-containing protein